MEKTPAITVACLARGAFVASWILVLAPVPSRGGGFSSTDLLVVSRLACFGALIISSCLITIVSRRGVKLARPFVALGAGALQLAAGLGYPLVSAEVIPQGFLTADLIAQGFVLPLLNALWGQAYASLDERQCTVLTSGSLVMAALFVGLHHGVPNGFSWVVSTLFPLSALALAWLLRRDKELYRKPPQRLSATRPSWRFLAGTFCAFTAANIMVGSAETGGFIVFPSVVVGTAVAAMGLVVVFGLPRLQSIDVRKLTMGALLVLTVAYTASGLVMGDGSMVNDALKAFQHCSVMALEQCMVAFTWLALIHTAQRTRVEPVFVVGLGFLAICTGKAVGSLLGIVVPLDPAALSIVALFMFVPAALFLGADALAASSAISNGPATANIATLNAFADAYGLSPREREVLELWIAGNRIDQVAEQLCVSKNTAKTHVTHIYRKTGTANREELLALVRRQ